MKQTTLWVVGIGIVLIAAFFALNTYIYNEKQGTGLPENFKEATFSISGEPVTLENGVAEVVTDLGGASKTAIRYFGNELTQDIDGDGKDDKIFLVTQEAGSNLYFYAVAALAREGRYLGSKAVLLGNHIAPISLQKGEGKQISVHYADRKPGEPLTTQPTVEKVMKLLFDLESLSFGELVENFEGESR